MWKYLKERRKHQRYSVDWSGLLHVQFGDDVETLPVHVTNVSLAGAGILIQALQVPGGHLIADDPMKILLELMLPEGMVSLSVAPRWFNHLEERGMFLVGLVFIEPESSSLDVLRCAIRSLR